MDRGLAGWVSTAITLEEPDRAQQYLAALWAAASVPSEALVDVLTMMGIYQDRSEVLAAKAEALERVAS